MISGVLEALSRCRDPPALSRDISPSTPTTTSKNPWVRTPVTSPKLPYTSIRPPTQAFASQPQRVMTAFHYSKFSQFKGAPLRVLGIFETHHSSVPAPPLFKMKIDRLLMLRKVRIRAKLILATKLNSTAASLSSSESFRAPRQRSSGLLIVSSLSWAVRKSLEDVSAWGDRETPTGCVATRGMRWTLDMESSDNAQHEC